MNETEKSSDAASVALTAELDDYDQERAQAGIDAAEALIRLADHLRRCGKEYGANDICGLVPLVLRWGNCV